MDEQTSVYDLGEVRDLLRSPTSAERPTSDRAGGATGATTRVAAKRRADPVARRPRTRILASLSILVPGLGHVLQRRYLAGSVWFGAIVGLGALLAGGWRILPRLWAAADALGLPPASAVWTLGSLTLACVALHTVNVLSSCVEAGRAQVGPVHSTVASASSLLIPGWGQLINGKLVRGGLLLAAVWVSAACWLLASSAVHDMLIAYQLHLPAPLVVLASEPIRWALPSAVWPLAVYDAWVSARRRRGGVS
jgi:hypothetical protein